MESRDVIVIGGGVAGLATAWALARAGQARVLVVEREPLLASHATGRNAAIYRQLEHDRVSAALAVRTAVLLDELPGGAPAHLRRTGALYVGRRERLEALVDLAAALGVACDMRSGAALHTQAPALAGGDATDGLWVPGDGVLDVQRMVDGLQRTLRAHGAEVRTSTGVARVLVAAGRVDGVVLDDTTRVPAGLVMVAAGAWCAQLGAASGFGLPITPLRRHLALLGHALEDAHPVVWRIDDEVYFRAESGGLLASPCDEDVAKPGVPRVDDGALEILAHKLHSFAPLLASSTVKRAWACLRSFAPDRVAVVGADPRVRGLHWVAGLGGRGMSIGLALGEVAAARLLGNTHPAAQHVDPARLVAPGS